VTATLAALTKSRAADALQLDNVIGETPLHRALVACGAQAQMSNVAVYVDMRQSASFEQFAQQVNKKTRKNLRNLLSRLQRTVGEVKHEIELTSSQIAPIIERGFAARLQWMHDQARTSPAFREPDFRTIVSSLHEAIGIELMGCEFRSPTDVLATQWGFRYAGRYYAYMSGRNPRFEPFSAGRLHLGMVIAACKERGIDVLELMAPAVDYKLTWSDQVRQLYAVSLPFSWKGFVVLRLVEDTLIRGARAAARRLPRPLRKRLLNPLLLNQAAD
jgi:CelD/BcsL family acetyltransferase involved in cellulose biosynthesis